MPRQFALLFCIAFVVWLFRADREWRRASTALWIPGIWLAIIGSRPIGYWLGIGAGATEVGGSPINLAVQGGLMLASLIVLQRRAFDWSTFTRENKALVAIYVYFAITAIWSYYPLASFKRICRDFGTVLMVLVILTETNDPFATARLLFVRVAYILFPFSVLLIKYYPEYGRMYSKSWEPMYTGVTTHKNALGMIVLLFGLFLVFDIMELRRNTDLGSRKKALRIRYFLLLLASWLLVVSNSKTSLICAILAGIVLWASSFLSKLRNPGRIVAACAAVVLALVMIDSLFGLSSTIIHAFGRKENLTGRTEVWQMVMEQPINPVIGYGFSTFWDGPQGRAYNESTGQDFPNSQNAYLDTYVDGGIVALVLLAWLLLTAGSNIIESLINGTLSSRAKLTLFITALVHDYPETSFFRMDPLWFALVLTMITCTPRGQSEAVWQTGIRGAPLPP